MRSIIVPAVLLAAILAGTAPVALAQNGRTCSDATLAGAWGYTESGTVITPTGAIPAAAVGRNDFDGEGHFTGTQYSNTAGTVAEDTKEGTYTVNPDCTATLTLQVYNGAGFLLRSSVWELVIVEQGDEMRGTMTSLVLSNGPAVSPVMSMTATRMYPGLGNRRCSQRAGTWGYSWTATFILQNGPAPGVALGTLRVDAAGNLTGMQTTNIGGIVSEDTLSGSTVVNPDCTGSMTVYAYDDEGHLLRTVTWALVFVDSERESRAMFKSITLGNGQPVPLVGIATSKLTFPGQRIGPIGQR